MEFTYYIALILNTEDVFILVSLSTLKGEKNNIIKEKSSEGPGGPMAKDLGKKYFISNLEIFFRN